VTVEVPAALAEAAADLLLDASAGGIESSASPSSVPRERLLAYLPEGPGADEAEARLRAGLARLEGRAGGPVAVRVEPLLEEDWAGAWKERFHPFAPVPGLVVKPGWEPYAAREGEVVIEMDPGMAFGTGLHASTRLALALLADRLAAGGVRRVLDVGTGTGILAMGAALLGAVEVVAIDTDPDALAAASANVARNALAAKVRVGAGPLEAVAGPFDLVVANITADVLVPLAGALAARLAPGGMLVLSGVLAGEQAAEVRAAGERFALRVAEERAEGEWAAMALSAPPAGEEIFELVDESGCVTGRAPRRQCHGNPALVHRAAHVVVLDGRGRLYLQKRSLRKDIQPGRWDTSVGGHLDLGEDHRAGAQREMREELGLGGELRFLYRYLWCTDRETELVETFLHVAAAEPRPDPEEVDEGRWFTREEADALVARGACTPNLAEELRRLRAAGVF